MIEVASNNPGKWEHLSVPGLAHGTRCHRVDDMVFLPLGETSTRTMEISAEQASSESFLSQFSEELRERIRSIPNGFLPLILEHLYTDHQLMHRGEEPPWIASASDDVVRYLRRNVVFGDYFEPYALVPSIPFTGIGYAVEEGGFLEELINTFKISRLRNIRQLGFLHDPVVRSTVLEGIALPFSHTRFCHVLDVTAAATLMSANNSLPPILHNTLRAAACAHDTLTPAGGDTTKLIDPEAFDEDKHFPELYKRPDWAAFRDRYGLGEQLLTDTILGKGVLGTILDLADKTSYVARDADQYVGRYHRDILNPHSYDMVFEATKAQPFVCGLWDAVEVRGEQVVINDAERLMDFLRLRALMFKELYFHPAARFVEHTLSNVVVKFMYDKGIITKDQLLGMTDQELEARIDQLIGVKAAVQLLDYRHAHVETFATLEEARAREAELTKKEPTITLVERFLANANSGTHFLVQTGANVLPLREAYPEFVEELNRILFEDRPYWLYHFPFEDVAPNKAFRRAYQDYQRRNIGLS